MSREIVKKVAFVIAALGVAAASASAQEFAAGTTVSIGAQVPKPSNNVTIKCVSSTQAYAAESWHASGDRYYGTSSTEPKIYWKSNTGTAMNSTGAGNVAATTLFNTTGWSAL